MSTKLLDIAIKAAKEAGGLLNEGFGTNLKISSKDTVNDLVTEYDHRSEEMIIDILSSEEPGSCFLAEEKGAQGENIEDNIRWVIDPLDGTVNYAHNVPIFSVSIAAEYKKELLAGVVYNPVINEMFTAAKGHGAYLNDEKLSISNCGDLEKSLLVTGFPYNVQKNPCRTIDLFVEIVQRGIPVRRLGSAALDLAYVAAGRFDGFWEIGLRPWDVAAGTLIVKEAGGSVTQFNGTEYNIEDNTILATNGLIHNQISDVLQHCRHIIE